MAKHPRRTIVLTVDSGPDRRELARFYRLVVVGEADTVDEVDSVRTDLLVPDGDKLRTAHRHDNAA